MKEIYSHIKEDPKIVGEEFAEMNVLERDLYKHSLITPIAVDVKALVDGKVRKEDGYLFAYFRTGASPIFATITK